ncbi:DUF4124 domain-containing protein [Lysobacter psychrotolerans]|uniref:DUF4124 domain-containing protein n=1 Tax=Montanilutibacter psychrotolerans TaxID=1327343 RepID=A0A3M8SPW4_9GAMM|nr:DUF4124 domain-containing protein [Lysobacter psychrotolerans]
MKRAKTRTPTRFAVSTTTIVLLMLGADGTAQHVYRCANPNGHVVAYQSTPCSAGTRVTRTWSAVPDPPPSPSQAAARTREQQRRAAESRYLSRLAGTDRRPGRSGRSGSSGKAAGPVIRVSARGGCEDARRRRDAMLYDLGSRQVSVQTRRLLHDHVYEACK